MATPLQMPQPNQTEPRTVQGAKIVELALVTFTDETNSQHTQLAIIGDNNVHLLEGRSSGFSKNTTPQGNASEWLKNAIFKALGKGQVEAPPPGKRK